jgi:hypothetical protein
MHQGLHQNLLGLKNNLSNTAEYKINMQKLVAVLYAIANRLRKELRKQCHSQ